MTLRIAFISLCAAVATLGASAQGLHKEINVDSRIDPVKRDASRINVLPTLQLPPLSREQLTFSDRTVTSRLADTSPVLAPVAYGDKLYHSPYRGYVGLGVGAPDFLADFSAGYCILSSAKTRFGIWTQYSGDIYSASAPATDKNLSWKDHSATAGLDFSHKIGSKSLLCADLAYGFAHHSMPIKDTAFGQNISRVNSNLSFATALYGLDCNVALHYRHFGFYHQTDAAGLKSLFKSSVFNTPVRQNLIGLSASGALPMGENSSLRLDVSGDLLSTGIHCRPLYPYINLDNMAVVSSGSTGLIAITPAYVMESSAFRTSIGAKINVSTSNDKTLHIAPAASFAWTPSQLFGLEIKATGGSDLNELSRLYAVTPYLSPYMSYNPSHIPYAIDGRLTFGPFLGAYAEIFGGYAKANNWLMPIISDAYPGLGLFESTDVSAWHAGAAIGYSYRDLLSFRASYEAAPHDYDKSYYAWRDRASGVLNTSMTVRPVSHLTVKIDWEFRSGRRAYEMGPSFLPDPLASSLIPRAVSLGCASDLSLNATYEFSDRLSFFARGENLLNRHYSLLGSRPAQGICGLIGASFKF